MFFRLLLCLIALAALPLFAHAGHEAAHAGENEALLGSSVAGLLEWVESENPELAALAEESAAARERVQPAGALPDPSLRVEWQDIPRNNPTLLPDRVGAVKYTWLQAIPFWGKRDLQRDIAAAGADVALSQQQVVRADVRARVKIIYAQYYQASHAARLVEDALRLSRDLEEIALARYAGGIAPQQDAIKAQVEQTALQAELIVLETEQDHARARLNAVLNRAATAPLAAPGVLRTVPALAVLEDLEQRLRTANPMLAQQTAQVIAAEHARALTYRNRYPDVMVGFSPVQRGSGVNNWEAMVEISIPLQQGSRRAREREAEALLVAAQSRQQAVVNGILGEFHESLAALEAARKQELLLQTRLLPQVELGFQSALAGYQTGKVDFATLLDAQRQIRQARLDELKARVEQQVRLAEIERLAGEEL
ncbi:MAG: TolC family protein [Pseudomonadota bacterium]